MSILHTIVPPSHPNRNSAATRPLELSSQPPASTISGIGTQSGWRESNSHPKLGKLMCCHYTTAAKNTLRLDKQQYIRLFPTLQLNLFNCIDLHSLSHRSGHKWSRIVLGSRTQSLPPPPATCQSSAVRSSNLTKFTHGCIEVLRH